MKSFPAIAAVTSIAALIFGISFFPAHVAANPPHQKDSLVQLMNTTVPSFTANREDVHGVLARLFRTTHGRYSIAPEVTGRVSLDVGNVSSEEVLNKVVRLVDATYRVEDGEIQVISRMGTREMAVWPEASSAQPVMCLDDKFLYILSYNMLTKVRKSDLKVDEQIYAAHSRE